jgi:hypothetical protein
MNRIPKPLNGNLSQAAELTHVQGPTEYPRRSTSLSIFLRHRHRSPFPPFRCEARNCPPQNHGGGTFLNLLSNAKNAISYMKRTTPEKYHDIIVPKYRLGQKRRVFDTDYLQCLNRENVLLTNDLVTRVTPTSVITTSGKEYEADVIILANGFHMQSFIFPMKIVNKTRGLTLDDAPETGVWRESGPQAYLGKSPNFFNHSWSSFHPPC